VFNIQNPKLDFFKNPKPKNSTKIVGELGQAPWCNIGKP
jgi:hypothetical protein